MKRLDWEEHPLPFTLRTYPAGGIPDQQEFCLDSIIGRPFLEFNSKIEIPEDVWVIITTAVVYCTHCGLVRTIDGDRAHRGENRACQDIGSGEVSFILNGNELDNEGIERAVILRQPDRKGKGRAY
jgi:hypothetical protein